MSSSSPQARRWRRGQSREKSSREESRGRRRQKRWRCRRGRERWGSRERWRRNESVGSRSKKRTTRSREKQWTRGRSFSHNRGRNRSSFTRSSSSGSSSSGSSTRSRGEKSKARRKQKGGNRSFSSRRRIRSSSLERRRQKRGNSRKKIFWSTRPRSSSSSSSGRSRTRKRITERISNKQNRTELKNIKTGKKNTGVREAAIEKLEKLKKAKQDVLSAQTTLRQAAIIYNLPLTTLYDFIKAPPDKPFKPNRGRLSKVFTFEEEKQIEDFLKRRASLGCGYNYEQLRKLMQEVLVRQVKADPTRVTGYEKSNHLRSKDFVYRFVKRSSLVNWR